MCILEYVRVFVFCCVDDVDHVWCTMCVHVNRVPVPVLWRAICALDTSTNRGRGHFLVTRGHRHVQGKLVEFSRSCRITHDRVNLIILGVGRGDVLIVMLCADEWHWVLLMVVFCYRHRGKLLLSTFVARYRSGFGKRNPRRSKR